jgi:hypothetical protein
MVLFFYALFFKSARMALAGFLLSTAPERAGHNGKAFEKKIRSPIPARRAADKRRRGRFFLQNRRPGLDGMSRRIRNLLYIKGRKARLKNAV